MGRLYAVIHLGEEVRSRGIGHIGDESLYALGSVGHGGSTAQEELPLSVSSIAGFDILSKLSGGRTVSNTGYASLRTSNSAMPDLFKIDLLSGKATKVDDLNKQIADIAVKQP